LVDEAPMGKLQSLIGVVVVILLKLIAMAKDADRPCLGDEFFINDEPVIALEPIDASLLEVKDIGLFFRVLLLIQKTRTIKFAPVMDQD
jgi:hypothetical protein